MLLEVKSAVDETADDKAVDNRNSTALGGSEHTEAHTDDDTEREEQTPEGDERLLEYLGDLRELVSGGGVIALLCDNRNDDHHGQGHQDARDIACGKDLAQRNLREQAVDDEVDSGRNDGGRSRRGGGDGRGERLGVTTSLHLGNQHLGLHCAVGVCGTGAAAHQHGQQHVDLCKAAAHMTGNTLTEVHDGARHDEEGYRQQREGLSRVHDLLENKPRLGGGINNKEIEERCAEQRVNDRHTHEVENEHEEYGDKIYECQCH